MTCPCGTNKAFDECCGPFLAGQALPETAEALMRSRYTAYARGDVDYIVNTHDPARTDEVDRKNTEAWSKQSQWLGLEILATDKGGVDDEEGVVEFLARYKIKSATISHRERATFQRISGRWYFMDGEEIAGPPIVREGPRVGRNDPCPCGSGKKHKKCCGVAA